MIAIFPEIAAAAGAMQYETASFLVRKYFGKAEAFTPRVNVVKLSQEIGIPVSMMNFPEYGALAVKDDGGRFTAQIMINASLENGIERNFLVAHLLGHFFLHAQPYIVRGEWENTGFKETFSPMLRFQQNNYDVLDDISKKQEMDADAFAAALLLPKAMLKRAMPKLKTTDAMSSFFGVGSVMLERRMELTGFLNSAEPVDFLGAEASLKEQKKPAEQPIVSASTHTGTPAPYAKAAPVHENKNAAAKVKRSMAVNGYQKKENSPHSTRKGSTAKPGPAHNPKGSPIEKSLKMFRDLASRLDSNVDKDK